jgi:hypothetical protein
LWVEIAIIHFITSHCASRGGFVVFWIGSFFNRNYLTLADGVNSNRGAGGGHLVGSHRRIGRFAFSSA